MLLGSSPDPAISGHFWHLKHHLNDNPDVHLELGFGPDLAHLVYAGADLLVMPSMFEPCGLAQLIALKYGTVPIVRAVGGLADTVSDRDYSARSARAAHRLRLPPARPPGAGVRDGARDRALVRAPRTTSAS